MKLTVYDKAKYYIESPEFPEDAPASQASVHIGFFLRWIIENGLLNPEWREDFAQDLEDFEHRRISSSELVDIAGGVLSDDMLSAEGKRFADACYDDYLGQYDDLFRNPGRSLFETEDTEENYARARMLIDAAYANHRSSS